MKILFTDIDGTLYNHICVLPKSAKEALRRFKANGNLIYMATGRSKYENKPEVWEIGWDGIICGNGNYIEDHGNVLYHKPIPVEELRDAYAWFKTRNIEYVAETNVGLFTSEHLFKVAKPKLIHEGSESFRDFFDYMSEGQNTLRTDINKVSFFLNSQEDLKAAQEHFKNLQVGAWANGGEFLFGEICVKGIDKGKAVKALCEQMHYDPKDCIAFGDQAQDIPMLQYCGLGLTFTSASDDIQAMADYVSNSVNEDGFYNAFKHFDLI